MPEQVIIIPNWHPTTLNKLFGANIGGRTRLKRCDSGLVKAYGLQAGITKATGRRRVDLCLYQPNRRHMADPDAFWKSTLDALVRCGYLVNDSSKWCELGQVSYIIGRPKEARIFLTDIRGLNEMELGGEG